MTQHAARTMTWVACETTGKRGYLTRGDARKARRRTSTSASPYECDECRHWHIGHVRHASTRAEYRHEAHEEQMHVRAAAKELDVSLPALRAAAAHLGIRLFNNHILLDDYYTIERLT